MHVLKGNVNFVLKETNAGKNEEIKNLKSTIIISWLKMYLCTEN